MHDLLGWHTPVIHAFGRRAWEDEEFKVILVYTVSTLVASLPYMRPCHSKRKQKQKQNKPTKHSGSRTIHSRHLGRSLSLCETLKYVISPTCEAQP